MRTDTKAAHDAALELYTSSTLTPNTGGPCGFNARDVANLRAGFSDGAMTVLSHIEEIAALLAILGFLRWVRS